MFKLNCEFNNCVCHQWDGMFNIRASPGKTRNPRLKDSRYVDRYGHSNLITPLYSQ